MKKIIHVTLRKIFIMICLSFSFLFGNHMAHAQDVLDHIDVFPSGISMVKGLTQTFTVTGKDAQGNTVPLNNPQIQGTGGTMTVTKNADGTATVEYTAGQETGNYYFEVWDADATDEPGGAGAIWGSADITIMEQNPEFYGISVSPDNVNMGIGEARTFTAVGEDIDGKYFTPTNPVWTTSGGGTITPNGTSCEYIATGPAGPYDITCTQLGTTIQGSANIDVTQAQPEIYTISVSPFNVNLGIGEAETFTATGEDQYGYSCTITDPVWTTSGGGYLEFSGTWCTYTATGSAGPYTITCTQQGTTVNGSANITITQAPPELYSISVSPPSVTLKVGEAQTFTATGEDQFGNPHPLPALNWSTSGGGSLTEGLGKTMMSYSNTAVYTAEETGRYNIICTDPETGFADTSNIHIISSTEILTNTSLPTDLILFQNFPNPFNLSTTFTYDLPEGSDLIFCIYNLKGNTIKTLVHSHVQSGHHQITWHGLDETGFTVPTGIYIARIETSGFTQTRKIMLIK